MNTKYRVVVATTAPSGIRTFSNKELNILMRGMIGIPVLEEFDQDRDIGAVSSVSVEEGKLIAEVLLNKELTPNMSITIGYIFKSLKVMCVSTTLYPEDTSLTIAEKI